MTARRRAKPKSWFATPEGLRTIGLLSTTILGTWGASHKSDQQAISSREGMAVVASIASQALASADSAKTEVRAMRERVRQLERGALRVRRHDGHSSTREALEPDGPPQPSATVWGSLKGLFAGIVRPFTGR